jgi:hypothetical protein
MKTTGAPTCPILQTFDQFGPGLFKLKGERELCVPSTVTP